MSAPSPVHAQPYLDPLRGVIEEVVAPAAVDVDRNGTFPRASIDALGAAGLLGLLSAPAVGGGGEGHRAATLVIEELARHCASTAMVTMMHYCAVPLVEAHAARSVRKDVAAGRHLLALALSESGSRSHFWAPVSTATVGGEGADGADGQVRLDARKSWVTSAGEADSYVWSSRPLTVEGLSTLWLVPASAGGLSVGRPFDGLGLRGNSSSPMTAEGLTVSRDAILGPDGGGFDLMMMVVLPYFQLMNAAFSVGTMEAATTKAAAHVAGTRLVHLDQSLADSPTVRAYVARMRIRTDMVRTLLLDTLDALEGGRDDVMLRVLEAKAAAGESATEVTDLAMRVCGGAAFRKEVGVERHFRDARAATIMAPTTDILYDFIGRITCGLPLFEEPS